MVNIPYLECCPCWAADRSVGETKPSGAGPGKTKSLAARGARQSQRNSGVGGGKGRIMKKRGTQGKRPKVRGKEERIQKQRRAKGPVVRERLPGVPPPESEIWPEEYRGKRWKPIYAQQFAGRCQLCAYSCPLPKLRQCLDEYIGIPRLLLCTNHPVEPGALREVLPTGTCRNFKARCWRRRPAGSTQDRPAPPTCAWCPGVRRIAVGQGLFATVDEADSKDS
jgi:hypothetical protein